MHGWDLHPRWRWRWRWVVMGGGGRWVYGGGGATTYRCSVIPNMRRALQICENAFVRQFQKGTLNNCLVASVCTHGQNCPTGQKCGSRTARTGVIVFLSCSLSAQSKEGRAARNCMGGVRAQAAHRAEASYSRNSGCTQRKGRTTRTGHSERQAPCEAIIFD